MYLQHNHVRSSRGGQVGEAQRYNITSAGSRGGPIKKRYYSYYSYYSNGNHGVAVVSRNLIYSSCITTAGVRLLQHGFSCTCRRQST